jgi:glycosyltransferase involved in cell wall biosynthesis
VLFPGNPSDPVKGFALAQEAVRIVQKHMREEVELAVLWEVAPENVPLYMNAADVMILTSFSEGSPNVVKEALACNLPIVSLPVGDVPELLQGVEECHVVVGNAETLSTTIVAELHRGRATNGRTAVQQKGLDLASVANRVLAVYESVPLRSPRCVAHKQSTTISPLPLD